MKLSLKNIAISSFCQLLAICSFAQNKQIPNIADFQIESSIKEFQKLNTGQYDVQIFDVPNGTIPTVKNLTYTEQQLPDSQSQQLKTWVTNTDYKPLITVSIAQKQTKAYVYIDKYRMKDGHIFQIKNPVYQLDLGEQTLAKSTGNRTYASQSILNSGQWHKIAVNKNNVYKIDFGYLTSKLGISASSIPSASIQLYGNGGRMLSWDNAVTPIDDLKEIPLKVEDGGDGQFQSGDYLLFYASGPDDLLWNPTLKVFTHIKNIFEDQSYYFLTINGSNGKRLTTQNLSTYNISTSKYLQHIYNESDSLIIEKVGGVWLGNEMSSSKPSKIFNYSIPNFDPTEKVKMYSKLAFKGEQGNGQIAYFLNENQIANRTFLPTFNHYLAPPFNTNTSLDSTSNRANLSVQFYFTPPAFSDKAYVDFFDLTVPCLLTSATGQQYTIKNPALESINTNGKWILDNTPSNNTMIWNVSDMHNPLSLPIMNQSGQNYFIAPLDTGFTYQMFENNSNLPQPKYIGSVVNQNLHALSNLDYIIFTPSVFKNQATTLANYRQSQGVKSQVIELPQLYNEFSGGSQDIVAIRNFTKMLYDKATSAADAPKQILLFGDASYDYKDRIANNTNFVPTYETTQTERINSYNTDDLLAFLDDNENPLMVKPASMDVGMGRIVCKTATEAQIVIDKIKNYESKNSFGNWRLNAAFSADNSDNGSPSHFYDSEYLSTSLGNVDSNLNFIKIYGDAYPLVSTPGGSRIPGMNAKLNSTINQGALFVNYNGHGGETGLAQEGILTFSDIQSWKNKNNLPIFITATCEFSKFDYPGLTSAGEKILVDNENGGVALVTTTQAVYQAQNRDMNNGFLNETFKYNVINSSKTSVLGESMRLSKNLYYNSPNPTSYSTANYQKFALLGDPTLHPALPNKTIIIDSIITLANNSRTDTLRSLGRYKMYGHIQNHLGQLIPDFNGVVVPTIYDKTKTYNTVYQYANTPLVSYQNRNSIIFKGKTQASNGKFECPFILPKDIQYQYGLSKISSYANNDNYDAAGYNFKYIVGGQDPNIVFDQIGPEVLVYLNDESFVNGGITNPDPILLLKLSDISGINTTGNSIGHDMTAILDNNQNKPFILNDYYEANINDFTKGTVKFPLYGIAPGKHFLDVKVWDGNNNSTPKRIDFEVLNQTELELAHVYNYPNPFSTKTNFMFEHNFPNETLQIMLKIYTIGGKLVKTINQMILSKGTRVNDIFWDGKDDFGDKIAQGTYYYKLEVKTSSGKSAKKIEKLYIVN